MKTPFDILSLRAWFLKQKRVLPWREHNSPYAVLISEVMLQQTQVSVVSPYFKRFMERFPDFKELAKAEEKELIKYWEGLGYYSRVKNLQKAAQFVMNEGGTLPKDIKSLLKIPGIGPYTAGAIRAFAFHERASAVDGNVMRVLARYFGIQEDISKVNTKKAITALAENLLPRSEPWIIAEALIELGALVCKKTPLCMNCPLNHSCKAYRLGIEGKLPIKPSRAEVTELKRLVALLIYQDQVLIRQVPPGEIMAGLHEFPYFEQEGVFLEELLFEKWGISTIEVKEYKPVRHSFTRYRVELVPFLMECKEVVPPEGFFFCNRHELKGLAFAGGHREIVRSFLSNP